MIDGSWRDKSFSEYDVVFHVAGLAHADVGNVDESTKKRYYAINTDLAIETCKKAVIGTKACGGRHMPLCDVGEGGDHAAF